MSDPQSMLQPGETLGPVTPQQAPDPNQGLLRDGETLGPVTPAPQGQPSGGPSGLDQWANSPGGSLASIPKAVVRWGENTVGAPASIYHAMTDNPTTEEEKHIAANGVDSPLGHVPAQIALPFWRIVGAPLAAASEKADQYEQMAQTEADPKVKKQLLDAAGAYRMGAKIPVVGPIASNLAERAAYGTEGASKAGDPNGEHLLGNSNSDFGGALTEGSLYAVTPEITKGLMKVPGAITSTAGDLLKSGVQAGSEAAGEAATKASYQVGKAGVKAAVSVAKNVGIPAVKGVVSGISDILSDETAETRANIAGKITDALGTLGDVSDDVKAKVADMAQKVKEGYMPTKDTIEQLANEHYDLVDDLVFRNLGHIADAVKSAASSASDTLTNGGVSPSVAQDVIKNAVNKVRDEWTYWTNRPPSVSGGSFDADDSFNKALNQELANKNITPPSDGSAPAADTTPTPVGPEGRTPLVDLANREPWAKNIPDGFTGGMKMGGKYEAADLRLRQTPGLGNEYIGKNDVFNDRLTEMYGKASVDDTLSKRAKEIFSGAQEKAAASGKSNPGAVASQIENGLRQPGWFVDTNSEGRVLTDSTARMKLVQQALRQAAKHTDVTSRFQSVTSGASSLGAGSVVAQAGRTLSPFMGGAIGGVVGGVGIDELLKAGVRKAFINPTGGVLDSFLAKHIADAPVYDQTAGVHFGNALREVPKGSTDPMAWTKTKAFQRMTPAEKVSAVKYADYSRRWFTTLKSILGVKPAPLKVPSNVTLPKTYNIARNDSQQDDTAQA